MLLLTVLSCILAFASASHSLGYSAPLLSAPLTYSSYSSHLLSTPLAHTYPQAPLVRASIAPAPIVHSIASAPTSIVRTATSVVHPAPAPIVHAAPAPIAHVAPSSIAHVAPAPVYRTVAAPVVHAAPAQIAHVAPAPVVRTVVAPAVHAAPAPIAHVAPAPVVRTVAAPVVHGASAPIAHVAPAPIVRTVAAPVVRHAATVSLSAPLVTKSQYHAQDELGQASYGHSEAFQAHNAVQDAAGNKIGSYSYVAPNGQVISTNYVADGLGFRVASNALPVAPAALPIAPLDTPEVIAARTAHLQEHAIVKSRYRRSVGLPLAYTAAISPLAYSTSVVHPATLTTIVNTPGHAVSYRVD